MGLTIEGTVASPLCQFPSETGSVLHAIKGSDPGFAGFGEAYFSTLTKGAVKGWKRHREMVCNLVVPIGSVKITLRDTRENSLSAGKIESIILSRAENYIRLTIPPGIWFSLEGIDANENVVLNIASIEHSDDETENDPIE